MLAAEGGMQGGQQRMCLGEAAMPGQAQTAKDGEMFGGQRIAAAFHHPRDAGLEGFAEAAGMQFRDEELRDLLRQVLVAIGVAGHLQLRQWIGAHVGEAERFENPREGQAAARQFAVFRPVDGADGAVVEEHLAARFALLADVLAAFRHGLDQLVEQAQVQRLGQPGAMHGIGGEGETVEAGGNLDVLAEPARGLRTDYGGNELEQTFMHGAGPWLRMGPMRAAERGGPQAKKSAGCIPFFPLRGDFL
ncbi:hypothetical protein D9M71_223240 [compost metagenome]